jgi:hypothetical protein
LSNIIIAVVVTIVLGLLFKVAKNSKAIKTADGEYVLRYSSIIKWFCMGLIMFATVGLTAILLKNPIKDDGDFTAVVSMYGALLLFGAYFYIEFFTVEILVSDAGIKGTSGWRGKRQYRWDEIDSISYSPTSMWFKVTSSKTPPLRIHALISGIDNFQRLYIEKLPEGKWIKAHEKFGQDKRVNK